ncbi:6-phosphogluconolactonase [Mucilaginibacter sp. CSA2-8R]|uniref:6-phosphogluconolactonase n=1 Tax=Mucilaginibacter sp. CSA2-8R TaxID=3141542 RepID=UPI00315DA5B6
MIKVFDNKAEISTAAAELFVQIAQRSISQNGKFVVALTGGSSPEQLYTLLAQPEYQNKIDWTKVFVFWGDERWVPLDDEQSNGKMADRTLLSKVPVPENQVFYMWQEGISADDYAAQYENEIRKHLNADLSFDLILLGMGPDGHTASLFPHQQVLQETQKLVAAYHLDAQNMYRITLTAPLINKGQHLLVMLYGENKAPALHEVLEGEHNTDLYPAQMLKPETGDITWLVDKAAASQLKSV